MDGVMKNQKIIGMVTLILLLEQFSLKRYISTNFRFLVPFLTPTFAVKN